MAALTGLQRDMRTVLERLSEPPSGGGLVVAQVVAGVLLYVCLFMLVT